VSQRVSRKIQANAGKAEWFGENDLYPDVRPTLARLRDMDVWLGVVGNQTVRAGGLLRGLDLPVDLIATSDDWGVQKPDIGFFRRLIESAPTSNPSRIIYVGDRIDNDLMPARAVGLRTIFIQRGPWGWIFRESPDLDEVADWRVISLNEIPEIVARERSRSS